MTLRPCSKKQEMMLANESDVLVLGGSAGSSKALRKSEVVYTPFGPKEIGSLRLGDIISAPDGSPQKVIGISDNDAEDVYLVTFDDDSSVVASGGHLWVTHKTKGFKSKKTGNFNTTYLPTETLLTTKDMESFLEKKESAVDGKFIKNQHIIIPLCDPIGFNLNKYKRPIPPYVLGALIGDGCISSKRNTVTLTTKDQEVVDRFHEEGYQLSQYTKLISYGISQYTGIKDDLEYLGLLGTHSHSKFIPEAYKYGSIKQRFDLVHGLMDTDGSVVASGHLSYTTVSKQLAEDFQWVVRSLGCKAKISKSKSGYKGKDGEYVKCRDAYTVFFKPSYSPERFVNLTRKKKRCREFNGGKSPVGRRIASIKKIGYEETRCITVSHPSRLFVTKDFIVTHNSWMLHMIAAKYLDCPNFKSTFMRRTTPQLMKPGNLWDTGKKVFGQLGVINGVNYKPEWRKGDQKLALWKHGPVIEYSHCQHEKDLENYQGSQMTLFAIDEGCQFEWYMIQYLFSRMRSDSKYKSRMLISCNPDPDHEIADMISWYIDEDGFPIEEKLGIERYFYVIDDTPVFRDTAEELIEEFPEMSQDPYGNTIPPLSFTFIASTIYDNPILIKNNPGYLSALKGLNDIDRARLLDGNWKVRPVGANFFKREDLQRTNKVPFGAMCCRAWDKASAVPTDVEKSPDFTASVKMYKTRDNEFYITGEYHKDNHDDWDKELYGFFRAKPGKRDTIISKQAHYDGSECTIVLPQDPGAAGKSEYIESAKRLNTEGFIVKKDPIPINKSKLTKASPFFSAVENGSVYIVESTFPNKKTLEYFYKQLEAFDGTPSTRKRKDEAVDVCATGYNFLSAEQHIPIVCRNQNKNTTKTAAVLAAR